MKRKDRDFLLLNVIREMRDPHPYEEVYELHSIGESLLLEYKDLGYTKTREAIKNLCGGQLHYSR